MPKIKKNSSVIHPNSRKALQLARQVFRNERLDKRQEEKNLKQKAKLLKFNWFKSNLDTTKEIYSTTDVQELIERYLGRFEEDKSKEQETKSLHRHSNSRMLVEYKTKFLVQKERQDYETCGIEIPDLIHQKSFATFKAWNGDAQLLPAIETVNVLKKQSANLSSRHQNFKKII